MNMKTILVTGGAGYIGSVAVKQLLEKNYNVIVVDNMSKGVRELVPEQVPFYKADLVNKKDIQTIFAENTLDAVIHFAAYKNVGESMQHPEKYVGDNVLGTKNLIELMEEHNVHRMIFSSSAAVYGTPEETVITESTPTKPINPYGESKLRCEQLLAASNLSYVALRYFNVAGDGGLNYIDPNALNIIPLLMEAVTEEREYINIFGKNHPTRDGTCVRDYISVNDLVRAHLLALEHEHVQGAINLGTGTGVSLIELIAATEKITDTTVNYTWAPPREGDPAELVANHNKAKKLLGWEPQETIEDMLASTYKAYLKKK